MILGYQIVALCLLSVSHPARCTIWTILVAIHQILAYRTIAVPMERTTSITDPFKLPLHTLAMPHGNTLGRLCSFGMAVMADAVCTTRRGESCLIPRTIAARIIFLDQHAHLERSFYLVGRTTMLCRGNLWLLCTIQQAARLGRSRRPCVRSLAHLPLSHGASRCQPRLRH